MVPDQIQCPIYLPLWCSFFTTFCKINGTSLINFFYPGGSYLKKKLVANPKLKNIHRNAGTFARRNMGRLVEHQTSVCLILIHFFVDEEFFEGYPEVIGNPECEVQ